MHTFLTPEPITIEIRNASGEIRVDLADVATTTVDVVAATSHPLGFLDDVIRAAKAQFAGDRPGVRRSVDPDSTRPSVEPASTSDAGSHGRPDRNGSASNTGPADRTVETSTVRDSPAGTRAEPLIVDTDPGPRRLEVVVHRARHRPDCLRHPDPEPVRRHHRDRAVGTDGGQDRIGRRPGRRGHRPVGRADRERRRVDHHHRRVRRPHRLRRHRGPRRDAPTPWCTPPPAISGSTAPAGNINARSVSGDVTVLDATSGSAELVTVSGDVEVGIHAGTLTAVDLSTDLGHHQHRLRGHRRGPAGERRRVRGDRRRGDRGDRRGRSGRHRRTDPRPPGEDHLRQHPAAPGGRRVGNRCTAAAESRQLVGPADPADAASPSAPPGSRLQSCGCAVHGSFCSPHAACSPWGRQRAAVPIRRIILSTPWNQASRRRRYRPVVVCKPGAPMASATPASRI